MLCAYNSPPHITEATVVRRGLRAGGRFVFDLYSEAAYASGWQGPIRAG